MKVIVTAIGFYGSLRQVGDEFEVPDDEPESSWFKPAPKPAKAKSDAKAKDEGKGATPDASLV